MSTERPFSAVVVARRDDKILLCQGPAWCLPGGKLKEGESVTDAMLREFTEETGKDVGGLPILKQARVSTHDGKPMDVFLVDAPEEWPGGWQGPEGYCRFHSITIAWMIYRRDWAEAFARAIVAVGLL